MNTIKNKNREAELAARRKGLYVVKNEGGEVIDSSDRIDSAMRRADVKNVPCTVIHVLSGKIVHRVS